MLLRGGSRGRVQGVRTPPWDDLRFSNTTGIMQKKKKKEVWFIGVEVEQETSAPPPKKNPGSAPVTWNQIGPVTYIHISIFLRPDQGYDLDVVNNLCEVKSNKIKWFSSIMFDLFDNHTHEENCVWFYSIAEIRYYWTFTCNWIW